MNVLGISTSKRKWGNTDLLVASVLKGAREGGAEIVLFRPADLDLQPCTGCMRCVFGARDCVIEDRFIEVLEALRWADSVVFGAPTYVLSPNSVAKNLADRLIQHGRSHEFRGKPALSVVTAGVPTWEGMSLAMLTGLPLFLGMKVIDQFVGFAQGPGEILDNADALARAYRGGLALAQGSTRFIGDEGTCPECHFNLVTCLPDEGRGHCEICDIEGTMLDGRFSPDPSSSPRFSREMVTSHFNEGVLPSGPKFKARVKEYVRLVTEFKKDFNRES